MYNHNTDFGARSITHSVYFDSSVEVRSHEGEDKSKSETVIRPTSQNLLSNRWELVTKRSAVGCFF